MDDIVFAYSRIARNLGIDEFSIGLEEPIYLLHSNLGSKAMDIGFIGLGNMGNGMATNLLKAGFQLTVYDLRHEAAALLLESGADWSDSPSQLASQCDVVLTSLPGPKEIEEVALGKGGLLEGIRPGKVYIDLSTGYPTLVRKIYAEFSEKNAHVMDAPVSGSTIGAKTGRLAVMASGDRAVFDQHKPVLDAIGDRVTYTGEIGSGTVCKLVHNCIGYGIQTIAAECYTLGVKAGVEPGALTEAVANGAVGRGVHFSFVFPETYFQGKFDEPHFPVKGAQKDVGLALKLGREHNVPMAIGNLVIQDLTSAVNKGWGEEDARKAMLLQEERAGNIRVRVPKNKN